MKNGVEVRSFPSCLLECKQGLQLRSGNDVNADGNNNNNNNDYVLNLPSALRRQIAPASVYTVKFYFHLIGPNF